MTKLTKTILQDRVSPLVFILVLYCLVSTVPERFLTARSPDVILKRGAAQGARTVHVHGYFKICLL